MKSNGIEIDIQNLTINASIALDPLLQNFGQQSQRSSKTDKGKEAQMEEQKKGIQDKLNDAYVAALNMPDSDPWKHKLLAEIDALREKLRDAQNTKYIFSGAGNLLTEFDPNLDEDALSKLDDAVFHIQCDLKRAVAHKHKKSIEEMKILKSIAGESLDQAQGLLAQTGQSIQDMKAKTGLMTRQFDAITDNPAFQADQNKLLTKLAQLSEKQNTLSRRLDELNEEKEELNRLAEQPGANIQELMHKNEAFQAKSDQLLQDITKHNADCEQTHKQLSEIQSNYAKQNKLVKEIQAQKRAMDKQICEVQSEISQKQNELERIMKLIDNLPDSNPDKQRLRDQANKLREEIQGLEGELSDLQDLQSQVTDTLRQLAEGERLSNDQLQRTHDQLKDNSEKLDILQAQLEKTDDSLKSLSDQVDESYQGNQKQLRQQAVDLLGDVSSLLGKQFNDELGQCSKLLQSNQRAIQQGLDECEPDSNLSKLLDGINDECVAIFEGLNDVDHIQRKKLIEEFNKIRNELSNMGNQISPARLQDLVYQLQQLKTNSEDAVGEVIQSKEQLTQIGQNLSDALSSNSAAQEALAALHSHTSSAHRNLHTLSNDLQEAAELCADLRGLLEEMDSGIDCDYAHRADMIREELDKLTAVEEGLFKFDEEKEKLQTQLQLIKAAQNPKTP